VIDGLRTILGSKDGWASVSDTGVGTANPVKDKSLFNTYQCQYVYHDPYMRYVEHKIVRLLCILIMYCLQMMV